MTAAAELGLENDGRLISCQVTGTAGRWRRCTHCRNHDGCRSCDNGHTLAGVLYRMWGRDFREEGGPDDLLLYVGVTGRWPAARLAQHAKDKLWMPDVRTITLEHFWDKTALKFAETDAIHAEHPRHNGTWQRAGETARLGG
jgi:hypothetical protein